MRSLLLLLCVIFNPIVCDAYPSYSNHWAHRSVIYFAPTNDEHVKQFLLETMINDCELSERDIVTLVITADGFANPSWVKEEFNLLNMFKIYGVLPSRHTAVLIGKDGTEKLRWGKTTDWNAIMRVIDLSPTREAESLKKSSPCTA